MEAARGRTTEETSSCSFNEDAGILFAALKNIREEAESISEFSWEGNSEVIVRRGCWLVVYTSNITMSDVTTLENENEILKQELEEKEKNLMLAAQYGKLLLDQNTELHTKIEKTIQECDKKIENFEQEKYSFNMKLEEKAKVISTLSSEIEIQEKIHKETTKKIMPLEDEIARLHRKVISCENKTESLQIEVAVHKEKSDSLQSLLEQTQQQQLNESFNPNNTGGFEEKTMLENQLCSLTAEKQEFVKQVLDLKLALKSSSLNLKKKETNLKKALQELEEKECQATSLFNEVERSKKENEELRMEIDDMKMAETNPRKKGNSLFAELEDNRQVLEKKVMSLISKCATLKKQCDIKMQQISKLKLHVASLLYITTNEADMQYQKHLEDSLATARGQLKDLADKQKEREKERQKQTSLHTKSLASSSDTSGNNHKYLKYLYDEASSKSFRLEEEVRSLCFSNACLNDELLQLRRKFYQVEKERDASKGEIIRMNVKLEEMRNGILDDTEVFPKTTEKEVVLIEKIPDGEEILKQEVEPSEVLREKFIQVESEPARQRDQPCVKDLKDKLPLNQNEEENENKTREENKSSCFKKEVEIKGKKAVKVNFSNTENEELKEIRDNRASKKVSQPKPRRKMEAPHIKVSATSETEECKMQ